MARGQSIGLAGAVAESARQIAREVTTAASSLRRWIPRRLRRWARRLLRPALYRGDFASWEEARHASRGYADPALMERVVASARAVRDGQAAWERDTVLFQVPEANAPLLSALRRAAAAHGGNLHLVDFGGALGSTWWQHRPWLLDLASVRWSVVEQPAIVEAGRREFTHAPLRFFASLDECCAAEAPDVVLLSSVLPYVEDPRGLLADLSARRLDTLIIDRTGFVERGRDRLTVQQVPPSIYAASYPCWFLDRGSLRRSLASEWQVVEEWVNEDDVDIDAEHRGMMLERRRS